MLEMIMCQTNGLFGHFGREYVRIAYFVVPATKRSREGDMLVVLCVIRCCCLRCWCLLCRCCSCSCTCRQRHQCLRQCHTISIVYLTINPQRILGTYCTNVGAQSRHLGGQQAKYWAGSSHLLLLLLRWYPQTPSASCWLACCLNFGQLHHCCLCSRNRRVPDCCYALTR